MTNFTKRHDMKNIPKTIYLQTGTDIDEVDDFNELYREAVTWCADRINDSDIEYSIKKEQFDQLRSFSSYLSNEWACPDIDDDVIKEYLK